MDRLENCPQMISWMKCCDISEFLFQVSYNAFVTARNDVALDVAHVVESVKQRSMCGLCNKAIPAGGVAVVAPKLGPLLFHPACFTCFTCKELLGESLITFPQNIISASRLPPRTEGENENNSG